MLCPRSEGPWELPSSVKEKICDALRDLVPFVQS